MGNKLYVGNLPYQVRDSDLEQAFGQFGVVTSAKVMMERDTGRSKGFGFVVPNGGGDRAFVHINEFQRGSRRPEVEGVLVQPSRPFLDAALLRRIRQLPNVDFLDGCDVEGVTTNSAPPPGASSKVISPPCSTTILSTIESPRPA